MEITKPGKLPSESMWKGRCSHCGCAVTFKQGEGCYVDDQRDGDSVTVKCPTPGCGREIYGSRA